MLKQADVALGNEAIAAERFKTQNDQPPIVVDFSEGFPGIMGDESRLEQVLST